MLLKLQANASGTNRFILSRQGSHCSKQSKAHLILPTATPRVLVWPRARPRHTTCVRRMGRGPAGCSYAPERLRVGEVAQNRAHADCPDVKAFLARRRSLSAGS